MSQCRFTGPFHQSHLMDYEVCPRMFYFAHVRQFAPESTSAAQLIGQAVHQTIQDIHALSLIAEGDIRHQFLHQFDTLRKLIHETNGQLRWDNDPSEVLEDTVQYLTVYAAKPFNQQATILLSEHEWTCQIGRYPFAGAIDQVREQDGNLILVDFKTSSYRPSEEFLRRSYQLSLYAYALWKEFGHPPAEIWHYQLKDHLPYRRSGSWGKAGAERGPAVYVTHRSEADLRYLEKDVSRLCAAIRFGLYFRRPANLGACNGFCRYTQTCLGELEAPVLHPSTIHAVEEVLSHEQVPSE